MSDLKVYIQRVAELTRETLDELLPPESARPQSIHKVMRYSVLGGGKRIRPCLLLATNEACGEAFGNRPAALAAAAVEMLHTFSLIHDDLPCMDNDDFRRGRPTAHRAFSEALAVLGGDALCTYAFEVLARVGELSIVREVANALGTSGMIGGQVADIESEGESVTRRTVERIHNDKTATFICVCVRTGAILAGTSQTDLDHLTAYGRHVGLAFQVVDDILDEEGTTEQLGKDAGSDREKGKATFPAIVGMDESRRYTRELLENACADIAFLGDKGWVLRELATFIRTRIS